MASTEDRIRKLLAENLEVDGKPLPQPVDFSNRPHGGRRFVYGNRRLREGGRPRNSTSISHPKFAARLATLNDLVKCLDGQMA